MSNSSLESQKHGQVTTFDQLEENPKVNELIRKQFKLSFSISFIILFVSFLIPTLNRFAPNFMAAKIFGYNLYYFVTALGIYPFVWILTTYYTKKSIQLEEDELLDVLDESESSKHVKEEF